MRTAIDTNVLSALWSKKPLAEEITRKLGNAKTEGGLVGGAPVYAELLAHPKAKESFVNRFLADTGIAVDFVFGQPVWLEAGRRFARYAKRRRKTAQTGARRLLADFMIGSHALAQADRLMTPDPTQRTGFSGTETDLVGRLPGGPFLSQTDDRSADIETRSHAAQLSCFDFGRMAEESGGR